MAVIDEWINPIYLENRTVEDIRQSVLAKPIIKYAVLDNFFRTEKLDQLIEAHRHLEFSAEQDRVRNGQVLPYDSAVCFATPGTHFGSELFFDDEWQRYCCYLTDTKLDFPIGTEIKLRYHRPDADGFWIHTDSTIRSLVIISYFNYEWMVSSGGLLQLWRVDEELSDTAYAVDNPKGRLQFLETQEGQPRRIRTKTPGGGFPDQQSHDLVLIDQIVPTYNRIFLCNFQQNPAYHSVTPSNGRERTGFVQWMFDKLREK